MLASLFTLRRYRLRESDLTAPFAGSDVQSASMIDDTMTHGAEASEVLARLHDLRELDAPTHGGKVLAYVRRPGMSGP